MPTPSPQAARRIQRSVLWTEDQRLKLPGEQVRPTRRQPLRIFAELTGENAGAYSWKKKVHDSASVGTLKDDPKGVTGTENAYEVSIGAKKLPTTTSTAGAGLIVELFRLGVDGTGNPLYGFNLDLESASTAKGVGGSTETEAAQSDGWDRGADAKGVTVTALSRTAYDHNATTPKLYGYYRDFKYDATGHLVSVSGETRVTIDTPEAC